MSDLYVLIYSKSPEKRNSVFLLEKALKEQGKKVACLTINTNRTFIFPYLKNDVYHYSIPIKAAESREEFEKNVPVGFDAYILEVTFHYSPIGAAFIDLFENVNEVVSYDHRDTWKQVALNPNNYARLFNKGKEVKSGENIPDMTEMWDIVHTRNVTTLLSQCPVTVDSPFIDSSDTIKNIDKLAKVSITPQKVFPKSDKKVIAVGNFPEEYWDIYPNLTWYEYFYAEFMEVFRAETYDLAIIGTCNTEELKIQYKPKHSQVICYHPSAYEKLPLKDKSHRSVEFNSEFSALKNTATMNSGIGGENTLSGINNRFDVVTRYDLPDPVWTKNNIVFCDGWITPNHLIDENLLEVV